MEKGEAEKKSHSGIYNLSRLKLVVVFFLKKKKQQKQNLISFRKFPSCATLSFFFRLFFWGGDVVCLVVLP